MVMSAAEVEGYRRSIKEIAGRAMDIAEGSVLVWIASNPGASVSDAREYAKNLMEGVFAAYGSVSSQLAAMVYDEIVSRLGAGAEKAEASYSGDPYEIDRAARYQASKLESGDAAGFAKGIGRSAWSHVWRSANGTMSENAARDSSIGMRYARVPSGSETCMFCVMLASRGFVYRTPQSAGSAGHRYHPGCDCVVVPGLSDSDVEGYDTSALYRAWADSGFKPPSKDRKGREYRYE